MDEKTYPPSSHKLQELRKQGIIPFSKTSLITFNIIVFVFSLNFFLTPDIISFNNSKNFEFNFLEARPILFYALKVSALSFLVSIIARLYLTKMLILPIKRYAKGNLGEERKRKDFFLKNLSLGLLVLLTGVIYSIYAFNSLELESLGPKTLISNILLPYFFLICAVLALISIYSSYLAQLEFLDSHRMSKAEILSELKELEGSGEAKKAIIREIG